MNIKKKLAVLSVLTMFSLVPALGVQAATADANITSTIGWKSENGAWYYYKPDNTKAVGWIKPDNNWYYLKEDDGKMATGWIKDNGIWYYLDTSGAMVTGWKLLNGDWYFLTGSGAMATGIQNDGSNLYYLKDSGALTTTTGWIKLNNKWYYINNGGKVATGWITDNNKKYYLKNDGSMVTGSNTIDGKTYTFNDSGDLKTGWIQSNNNWYYFDSNGNKVTGWVTLSGVKYYLKDDGTMATGWLSLDGSKYYLHTDGSMAIGWVTVDGSDYYLDTTTGKMLTNTTKDGYKIGADGKRTGTSSLNTAPPSSTNNSGGNTSSGSTSNSSGQYYGIDISNYDGTIDFNAVKSSGVQLVYIKATEGTTFIDPYLQVNYSGASAAGLKTGFYHFLVGTSAPETQADNFYNNIKDKRNDLKPMLDIETSDFDVMDYTLRFIAEFKKVSNMNIGIYTYSSFISNLDGRLSTYPLWEANYNNTPLQNLPTNSVWFSRVGHQYSDTGYVTGIGTDVDLDEFTGGIFS
ncbi:GH25 family lysozyme [Clostridium sp. BL-8]|uniref:GH25 family lysozyme n=1 Tax=Clostridium sp. BL-8 TaxID=349938 RepID=UPI00098C8DA9|nr:GH25 family lysozyme [Clostridium sp. BL-8]OOM78905.1 autolytic lysozyme [Clostridium sp. BL-8]